MQNLTSGFWLLAQRYNTANIAKSLGGFISTQPFDGTQDKYDAYRHALISAALTQVLGEYRSKQIMDQHEIDVPNLADERNMDLWNNDVGRREYYNWRQATDLGTTTIPLDKWIYDKVISGETINDLVDHRSWVEPPEGTIPTPEQLPEGDPFTGLPWPGTDTAVNTGFQTAVNPPRRDPLAIDLDGDGIETVGVPASGSPVLFDHDADGIRTGTGWLKGDDAWLVLDRDGNGSIDSGRELFGVDTVITVTETLPGYSAPVTYTRSARNGFEALRSLDTGNGAVGSSGHGDGVFNSSDASFSQVKLWQDLNQDGISQSNELFTLVAKEITSISLNASTTTTDLGNGNMVTGQATVTRSNGSTTQIDSVDLQASNLNLADNPFYREFTDSIPLTEAAKALPEMGGSGKLRDLREAMSQRSELTSAVDAFASATTRDAQRALLGGIVQQWAETTPWQGSVRNFHTLTAGHSAVVQLINPSTANTTFFRSFGLGGISAITADGPPYDSRADEGFVHVMEMLERFNGSRWFETLPDGSVQMTGGAVVQPWSPPGSPETWQVSLGFGDGGASAIATAYSSLLESVYYALVVQTRLRPYLDAVELVIDQNGIGFDTAPMVALLDSKKVSDERNALLDLVELNRYTTSTLQAVGFDGVVNLRSWIDALPAGSALRAELVTLDVLNASDISGTARPDIYLGDGSANTFNAGGGNDVVDGGLGYDALNGGAGDDLLLGREGDDDLTGEAGNDTLDGGVGDDTLFGGDGADKYLFRVGSGADRVINMDTDAVGASSDSVLLADGITSSNVAVNRLSDDLVIRLIGSDDALTVVGYFATDGTTANAVEYIRFADGTAWDIAAVKARVLLTTAGNDTIAGYASDDVVLASDGNDTISGRAGDDTLDGGTGADALNGGDGNDTLMGGAGLDYLAGEAGSDLLLGNDGIDTLVGGVGSDTLDGGTGADSLFGGDGADTYLFNRGTGSDMINNADQDAVGVNADTILLGAGITTGDLSLSRSSNNLVVAINGTDDRLLVAGYFDSDAGTTSAVDVIRFADGSTWDVSAVKARVQLPTADNDFITGYGSNDTLNGGDGNDGIDAQGGNDLLDGGAGRDALFGGAGNDTLLGREGNDILCGDAGADTLDGGVDNDELNGGDGADTYLFGKGSGQDTISNYDGDVLGVNADSILLDAGITAAGVALTRSYDDLVIRLTGTDDTLRVNNYFAADATTVSAVETIRFADGTSWGISTVKTKVLSSTAGNDFVYGYASNDTLSGGDGNDNLEGRGGNDVLDGGTGIDVLSGGDGNDTVTGGTGNDYVYGGNGNDTVRGSEGSDNLNGDSGTDTLDGGAGSDTLWGGDGADTYLFGKGSGQDTIYNYDSDAIGVTPDSILLGAGITTTGVTLIRSYDDLVIGLAGSDDALTVAGYFIDDATTSSTVEFLKFADGTSWDVATVKTKISTAVPPTGVYVTGTSVGETLTGGLGNDTLDGGAGNDTLDGGAGDDTLTGGMGNDTYLFNVGSGKDTIYNFDTTVGKIDTVQLGAGITATGVTLTRSGDDLLLTRTGSSDSLRMSSYFDADGISQFCVEKIKFASGTIWDPAFVRSKVLAGTANNDVLAGYATADTLSGLAGDDEILGRAGNDTLDGGAGQDTLGGDDGDDVLKGGTQNDIVNGGNGNDNLQGQDGDDTLHGDAGNDTLDGGAGDDILYGDAGSDTYVFNVGSGKDTIYNLDMGVGKLDVVQLGAGIATSSVTLSRTGDDLLLLRNGSSDSLRVAYYFDADGVSPFAIEQIRFADGTIWDTSTVRSKVAIGTTANDVLTGYATADSLSGLAGDDTIFGRMGDDSLDGGAGEDSLSGDDGDDILAGGTQSDVLVGGSGNDSLQGQDGNDTLDGGFGNDSLDGGAGDDALNGGTGNDTYLFNIGSGKDTIFSYDSEVGKLDVVQMGAGITTADVVLARSGDDLLLSRLGSSDSLRVSYYFSTEDANPWGVEQFRFADGTIWDAAVIRASMLVGTAGDDSLVAYATADTLDGGAGDDVLSGGLGSDTYLVGRGAGSDLVQENDATPGSTDVIQFGAGVTAEQLWFRQVNADLEVSIIGTADKVTLSGWYLGNSYYVEQFKTSDGRTLLDSQVQGLVSAMASFLPPAAQTDLPTNYQTALLPVIAANWGP